MRATATEFVRATKSDADEAPGGWVPDIDRVGVGDPVLETVMFPV